MSQPIQYALNRASETQIAAFLHTCDASFSPTLSERIEIAGYAHKIANKAQRFEAWEEGELVGLVATYCNATDHKVAYVTSVSVLPARLGKGIGAQLMERCITCVLDLDFAAIELEVGRENSAAISLYKKFGFVAIENNGQSKIMKLNLAKRT